VRDHVAVAVAVAVKVRVDAHVKVNVSCSAARKVGWRVTTMSRPPMAT
jgi:hypothetical protein